MKYLCDACGSSEMSIFEEHRNEYLCDPCWDGRFDATYWAVIAFRDLCDKT